ncbi:MAG TPA: tetratricopeptide repeat protein, partial [Tepidisphaeraceae bacterium]|nr:tetratricopeptide repeat protein [Tepidisphaeraceae bacterium]
DVCQLAISIQPNAGPIYNSLGNALRELGRFDEAIKALEQAVRFLPNLPQVHSNLGTTLHDCGRSHEALAAHQRAIALDSTLPELHSNMGTALRSLNRPEEAAAAHRRAMELQPNSAILANNLANALKDMGCLEDAVAAFDRAVALDPAQPQIASNRLYSLTFHRGYDASALLRQAREWTARFAAPLRPAHPVHPENPSPDRRLRIGYVSPDLRDHVVGRNLVPLFRQHDHHQFEIFAYPTLVADDAISQRLRGYCDHWKNLAGTSDESAAQLIRADKIDILVDLSLHMAANRLLIFARKPAPAQLTFAGYPGGTGLDMMDFRLTDPWLDPPGQTDADYVEKSIRLPATFWCYDIEGMDLPTTPPCTAPPALVNGFITFGCLNNPCKINQAVLDLWDQLLRALPTSRLAVMVPSGPLRRTIDSRWPGRVIHLDRCPRGAYQEYYQRIDIGLDTFPYNGHTTSLDSYWMGVPVVTLVGHTVVGRAGWSHLNNLALGDLAAHTPDQFVKIAISLANDSCRLAQIRSTLRTRMMESPLMNAAAFARAVESAYRQAWRASIC